MTADVVRIHQHVCAYRLFVAGKGWVSTSSCCYGDVLPLDPPGPKPRAVA